ncbi:hypothetical protein ACOSP7_030200 [Xanthoceras sorbifolium]
MIDEYEALVRNNTWELVPSLDKYNIIGNKWVFRIKYHSDVSVAKFKARLVAKDFHQTPGVDFCDTFSAVLKPFTLRVIFTLTVTNGWQIQQIDVNNTFLNGELKDVVYMEQPLGFVNPSQPHHVCKLKKVLYGLKQALRGWFP